METNKVEKEIFLKKINDKLSSQKISSNTITQKLNNIEKLSHKILIDFKLIYRGLKKVLLKRGNKKKNIETYFDNLNKAFKKRIQLSKLDSVDFEELDHEGNEPSIISKDVYKRELFKLQVELLKLQEWLTNTNKTVVIVFEGRDGAGKGSTIKKFVEHMNPKGFKIIALGVPTEEEKNNWWNRYNSQIENNKLNLFDRSWYNRGIIEPVMGYCTEKEYNEFMNGVEEFETNLTKNGDFLFKLWFSIDKDTQEKRFEIRKKSLLKYWKYSQNDSKVQELWDKFTTYKEKVFHKTSTEKNPWVLLDANDKQISGLNAIRYVLQNIPYENKNYEVLDKEYPEAIIVLKPELV
jgi:polyphosphate kinase 2